MRAVGDRRGEAFVLNQIGLLYDALGERKESQRYHGELVQLLRATGNCQEIAAALSNLAWNSVESDDKRKAVEYLNEALSIQQTVGDRRGEAEKKYAALADQLVLRGRQRGELLAKPTRSPEEEQLLARIETELQASGQAFQAFLDRLGDEPGNTRQAARVDQLRDSQALMDDLRELGAGAVALYTLVGAEKYRVILITPSVQKAAEYTIRSEQLERKVFALREALRDPRSDVRPLAEEMYRILVGPVAKDLRDAQAETLMRSLDGPLRYVPMSALHDGERYMVERYRNVVFTPASNSRLKDAPSARWNGFGAGATKSHEGFSPLPGVQEELRGIIREQEAQGGGVLDGRVILDDAFTLDTFRTGLRQRFQIVHVASHFAVQPGN